MIFSADYMRASFSAPLSGRIFALDDHAPAMPGASLFACHATSLSRCLAASGRVVSPS